MDAYAKKWLQLALHQKSKKKIDFDPLANLAHIHATKDWIYATDGKRVHFIKNTYGLDGFIGGEGDSDMYPNMDLLFPKKYIPSQILLKVAEIKEDREALAIFEKVRISYSQKLKKIIFETLKTLTCNGKPDPLIGLIQMQSHWHDLKHPLVLDAKHFSDVLRCIKPTSQNVQDDVAVTFEVGETEGHPVRIIVRHQKSEYYAVLKQQAFFSETETKIV